MRILSVLVLLTFVLAAFYLFISTANEPVVPKEVTVEMVLTSSNFQSKTVIDPNGKIQVFNNDALAGSKTLSQEEYKKLLSLFSEQRFFDYKDQYTVADTRVSTVTVTYTTPKKKKTVYVMKGSEYPKGFDEIANAIADIRSVILTKESSPYHAPDYSWVVGKLRYNLIGEGFWELIFVDDTDSKYGGKFVLGNPNGIELYKDGDSVKVTGRVSGEGGSFYQTGSRYEVSSIVRVKGIE